MRVALVRELPYRFPGGVSKVLRMLVRELSARGDEVLVLLPEGPVDHRDGAHWEQFPYVGFPGLDHTGFVMGCTSRAGMRRRLRRFRPDVVHFLHPMTLALVGILAVRDLDLPIVSSYHTQYDLYTKHYPAARAWLVLWHLQRTILNRSEVVLAPSRSVAQHLRRRGVRRPRVWMRGVDSERFSPRHRSRQVREELLGARDDELVLLYAGRVVPEKSVQDLVGLLAAGGLPWRLAVAGDGCSRGELEEALRGRPARFLGNLPPDRMPEIYASADALIMPSVSEGCPNVVLEALASGLPVVGADGPGTRELIEASGGGRLYPPGDRRALLEVAREALLDPVERRRLGEAGVRYAARVPWRVLVEDLVGYYRESMARRRGGWPPGPGPVADRGPEAVSSRNRPQERG